MIPKYLRGTSFDSLIRYLVHAPGRGGLPRPGATVLGVQGVLDIDTAAIEMGAVARRSERVRKPVVHLSLSLSPSEQLDDTRWIAVVDQAERELGLAGHQRVVVRHDDADHSHVHVCWNAIHPDTSRTPSANWDSHAKRRLSRLCRTMERELGLRLLGQPNVGSSRPPKVPLVTTPASPDLIHVSPGQEARERRTGEPSLAETHGARIKIALRHPTWDERAAELATLGLRISLYLDPRNPRRRGLVIADLVDVGQRCVGSDLGSDYALGAIERRSGETLDRWLSKKSAQPLMAAASVPKEVHASFDQDRARLWDGYLQSKENHRARRDHLRRKRKQQDHAHQVQRTTQRDSQRARRRRAWRAKDSPGLRWLIRQIAEGREGVERRALQVRQRRERAESIQASGITAAPRWGEYLTRQAAAGDDGAARVLARMKSRDRRPADRLHEGLASEVRPTTPRVERSGVPLHGERSASSELREEMPSGPAPAPARSDVRPRSPSVSSPSRGGRGRGPDLGI